MSYCEEKMNKLVCNLRNCFNGQTDLLKSGAITFIKDNFRTRENLVKEIKAISDMGELSEYGAIQFVTCNPKFLVNYSDVETWLSSNGVIVDSGEHKDNWKYYWDLYVNCTANVSYRLATGEIEW